MGKRIIVENHFNHFDSYFTGRRSARNLFGGFAVGTSGGRAEQGATPLNSHDISVSALYFALDHIETPALVEKHPDWTQEQVREEGIKRIERRSKENIQYYLAELERKPVSEIQWDIVESSPGVREFATLYGGEYVTRRQLWENFEKRAKAEGFFDPRLVEEKNAQLAMEQKIVSGEANGYASFLSHDSGTARLLQVFERVNDGRVVSRQYDIGALVGRDLTGKEAEQVLMRVGQLYKEHAVTTDSQYPHVLSKQTFHIEDIAVVARMQISDAPTPLRSPTGEKHVAMYASMRQFSDRMYGVNAQKQEVQPGHLTDTISKVTHAIAADTKDSVVALGGFVVAEMLARKKAKTPISAKELHVGKVIRERKNTPVHLYVHRELSKVIHRKTHEAVVKAAEQIVRLWHTSTKVSLLSRLALDTGVLALAVGGLRYMSKDLPRELATAKKSFKEKRRAVRRIRKSLEQKQVFAHALNIGKRHSEQKKKRYKRDVFSFLGKEIRKRIKTEKKAVYKETKILKPENKLLRILARIARRLEQIKSPLPEKKKESRRKKTEIRVMVKSKETRKQRQKETVLSFSFAVLCWLLLREPQKKDKQEKYSKKDILSRQIMQDIPEHAPTPWILLSIVWYLTMLREQGMQRTPAQAQKKKQQKKVRFDRINLPDAGVIFAFGS